MVPPASGRNAPPPPPLPQPVHVPVIVRLLNVPFRLVSITVLAPNSTPPPFMTRFPVKVPPVSGRNPETLPHPVHVPLIVRFCTVALRPESTTVDPLMTKA